MYAYSVEPMYFQVDADIIAADFYRPKSVKNPAVVVMAHDIALQRSCGLAAFAKRFAAAGYAVVVFDYRGFGGSTAKERSLVSITLQLADWQAVLEQLQKRKDIHNRRIVLWGIGLSGGHVFSIAAKRSKAVQAVIAITPFLDGQESLKYYPKRYLPKLSQLIAKDYIAKRLGLEAETIPVVASSGVCCLFSEDSEIGYNGLIPEHVEPVRYLPARTMLSLARYRPILALDKIAISTLLIAATQDQLIPVDTLRLAAKNLAPFGQYHEYPIGHFEIYQAEWFEQAIAQQIQFLHQHIGVK